VLSLRGLTWEFRKTAAALGYELVTVADEIEVILSSQKEPAMTVELEGLLRGIAARLVVALE
jgi:hypothetical protein